MANKIGSIKAYRDGEACEIAAVYDEKLTPLNLTIHHNGVNGYVALTAGNADSNLSFWHDGTKYTALKPAGSGWSSISDDSTKWGWFDAGSNATIQITNVRSVSGDDSTVTVALATGKTASDVSVIGAASNLIITVRGTAGFNYRVENGGIVPVAVESTVIINRTKRRDGKTVSRKYSHVNPLANDENIAGFFNALNALSDNTKQGIFRVDKNPNK